MTAARFSMHIILTEQTERTRGSSTEQIKQFIEESDEKLASLENEITSLDLDSEPQIMALAELRDREHAAGAALRSLIAPVRTLPVELLGEIFLLTIFWVNLDSNATHQDAFRISHVCRHWRQVTNDTPRLWTGPITIKFSDWKPDSEAEGKYASGLRAWLARSAPLPVHIVLSGLSLRFTQVGSRITDELLRVTVRWGSLRFLQTVPGSLVQRLAHGTLDALEELELGQVKRDFEDVDPTTILSFTTAPRLRKLKMYLSSRIPMPWSQLTDITFSTDSISHTFLDIFGQCRNVARASISVTQWSIIPPDSGLNMLLFEHLRHLSVDFRREVHNMRFLDCISAPALDELHLFFAYERGAEWAEASLTAFQLRMPNITKLEIHGNNSRLPPSNALTVALLHAPSLTHLSVRSCPESIDNAFLRALCYIEGTQPLVPCLHTLVLTDLAANVSEDVLASMITSRWWTDVDLGLHAMPSIAARWSKITLQTESSMYSGLTLSQNFRDKMEDLRQTGLALEWMDRSGQVIQRSSILVDEQL